MCIHHDPILFKTSSKESYNTTVYLSVFLLLQKMLLLTSSHGSLVFLWKFLLRQIPRNIMAKICIMHIFTYTRYFQTAFQSGYTNFDFNWQFLRVYIASYPFDISLPGFSMFVLEWLQFSFSFLKLLASWGFFICASQFWWPLTWFVSTFSKGLCIFFSQYYSCIVYLK